MLDPEGRWPLTAGQITWEIRYQALEGNWTTCCVAGRPDCVGWVRPWPAARQRVLEAIRNRCICRRASLGKRCRTKKKKKMKRVLGRTSIKNTLTGCGRPGWPVRRRVSILFFPVRPGSWRRRAWKADRRWGTLWRNLWPAGRSLRIGLERNPVKDWTAACVRWAAKSHAYKSMALIIDFSLYLFIYLLFYAFSSR